MERSRTLLLFAVSLVLWIGLCLPREYFGNWVFGLSPRQHWVTVLNLGCVIQPLICCPIFWVAARFLINSSKTHKYAVLMLSSMLLAMTVQFIWLRWVQLACFKAGVCVQPAAWFPKEPGGMFPEFGMSEFYLRLSLKGVVGAAVCAELRWRSAVRECTRAAIVGRFIWNAFIVWVAIDSLLALVPHTSSVTSVDDKVLASTERFIAAAVGSIWGAALIARAKFKSYKQALSTAGLISIGVAVAGIVELLLFAQVLVAIQLAFITILTVNLHGFSWALIVAKERWRIDGLLESIHE
jgi:hypothetical protein